MPVQYTVKIENFPIKFIEKNTFLHRLRVISKGVNGVY